MITPPDVADLVLGRIPSNELPFVAISPFDTTREVATTRQIGGTHTVQIIILDHFPLKEDSVIGGGDNKGIIGHVNDVIKIVDFNTLDTYLSGGAMLVSNIKYSSLDREPELFQIAKMNVTIIAPLELFK